MISKYQFMESNTQRRGQGLREKIPDIRKTLEMVRFLKLRKEVIDTAEKDPFGPEPGVLELEKTISNALPVKP